jgi:hypothetical protein
VPTTEVGTPMIKFTLSFSLDQIVFLLIVARVLQQAL